MHQIIRPIVKPLAKTWAKRRARKIPRPHDPLDTLIGLLKTARDTRFGREHGFADILAAGGANGKPGPEAKEGLYQTYCKRVPLSDYPSWVEWLGPHAPPAEGNPPPLIDQAWPGRIDQYCLSSGTSTGRTKFIPYSREMAAINRDAALDFYAAMLQAAPEITPPAGKTLYMSGSTNIARDQRGVLAGDMSALTKYLAPRLLDFITLPPAKIASMEPWEKRLEALVQLCVKTRGIAVLSGIPIWQLTLLEGIQTATGQHPTKILPELRYIIHGGMSIAPYKARLTELAGPRVRFVETYAASEIGIGAYQVPGENGMRFFQNYRVFYEFEDDEGQVLQAHQVKPGETYSVLASSCSGLWRYRIGDRLCFSQTKPMMLDYVTRDKTTSTFDEKVTEKNLETAMSSVSPNFADFSLGPDLENRRHVWFICTEGEHPGDQWLEQLDNALRATNQDYDDYRGDGRINAPIARTVPDRGPYLELLNRAEGGQRKFPRLLTEPEVAQLLQHY